MVTPITLTVLDTADTPMQNVAVSFWTEEFTVNVANLSTDADGQCEIGLVDGNYKILVYKEGYTFNFGSTSSYLYSITVDDDPYFLTVTGTAIEEPTPIEGKVVLYGYVHDINGLPLYGVNVFCRITPQGQEMENITYNRNAQTTTTTATGFYYFVLIGGLKVTLTIPVTHYQKIGILPTEGILRSNQLGEIL